MAQSELLLSQISCREQLLDSDTYTSQVKDDSDELPESYYMQLI
jgi:hypothetical protein